MLKQILQAFFSPAEIVSDIRKQRSATNLIVPALILVLSAGLYSYSFLTGNLYLRAVRNDFSPAEATQFNAMTEGQKGWVMDDFGIGMGIGLRVVPFLKLIVVCVGGLLVRAMLGGRANIMTSCSIAMYAALPSALWDALAAARLEFSSGLDRISFRNPLPTSVGYFFGPRFSSPVNEALSWLDAFTLWSVVLASLSFSELTSLPRWRAAIAVVGWFAAWVLLAAFWFSHSALS